MTTQDYETGFSNGSTAAINGVLAWLTNIGAGSWAATIHEAWEDGRIPAAANEVIAADKAASDKDRHE